MTSYSDFFRKYMDILAEAEIGGTFKVGDKIAYTFAQAHPPEVHNGTIVKLGTNNRAQIQWDDGAGPSQSAYDSADVLNGFYNLHWAKNLMSEQMVDEDEGQGGFQAGDHVVLTNVHASPPKTYQGVVKQVMQDGKLQLNFTDATGAYKGPSQQEYQELGGSGNGVFDAHFVRKAQ